ncbi:MAG: 50S ribosomal protein L29 [Nitrospinaceae bacterium]
MKIQDIKELSEKEREEKLSDLREEYFNLKFQMAMGKIENPGRLKYMRRDIARIMTLKTSQPTIVPAQIEQEKENKKTADKK